MRPIDALDTAIEHYDGIAEECRKKADIERNDYMDMRDDAYEARQLAQWLNELKYLRGKIEQLTIKPEPQCIPCSERLPETTDTVLTTYIVNGDRSRKYVEESSYYENDEYWCSPWDNYRIEGTRIEVIAWMPMPEAYKEGGERI